MGKFDRFTFSASPHYDEAATRTAFSKAVPLKTLASIAMTQERRRSRQQ